MAPLVILLALGACSQRDDAVPPQAGAAAPVPKATLAADPFTPRDVSRAALVRVGTRCRRAVRDRAADRAGPRGQGAPSPGAGDGTFNAPSITVMTVDRPPATLEAAVAAAKLTSDPALVVATQQQVHDGFLVSVHRPDDHYMATELTRTFGGQALRCLVVYRTTAKQGPIPARALTTTLAETICVSLAPR
jgi:hypothetical protein